MGYERYKIRIRITFINKDLVVHEKGRSESENSKNLSATFAPIEQRQRQEALVDRRQQLLKRPHRPAKKPVFGED